MTKLTNIGLQKEDSKQIADKLNELLANYHLYYQNLRGFHWNIKGVNFFQLHAKFEELYNTALTRIDAIAERILTVGQQPLHTFSDYLRVSTIKEAANLSSDKDTINTTHQNLTAILNLEREIMSLAAETGDEGTISLLSEDINENEKTLWMLNAFLS
ncbi:DNA starvation/stationary phase protection protein [Pontibacter sp. BT310]|uniref:DNA starvation/stationary phase protection protein n=1 Tax=Pontibacter populi TaxID=890055 RepID=A0ABS6XE40_9BACT|nr:MULTISPECIES: Dps family protein [Pontibacter]MBJ6119408.1 DNA starvation/stationary phase protection protein [Pontibacter sp. BT310]MBR0571836.1 DNA starvation/stationary phase protection protein [Microvirga sp. STS03]MBW3366262.1 DNA starvation/stationary phase protection protein [Pontibacter populi]